jgi:RNA polymerase sigma factor (sigma-70 family)
MKKDLFQNDAQLLAAMSGSEQERRRALQHFFENPRLLAWVTRHVQLQGGSQQDAQDVFEEAFIVFERQVRTGHFRGESSLETWFHGIARWQWLAFRRKSRPTTELEHLDLPPLEHNPENLLISDERRVILQRLIAQVGERCQMLLALFQLNHSMREIREILGYASDQVAANETHSCREKLKKLIHQHPESLEVLKNRADA